MAARSNQLVRTEILHVALALVCNLMLAEDSLCADDPPDATTSKALVIAHRGSSGYLPEHTEGAKVLAFAQGADVLEQDVVLSRDEVFVVSHDINMDHTTNVAELFPDRMRQDGRFYYADFDWSELRTISLHERTLGQHEGHRFPYRIDSRLMRLEDEIKLIQGLGKTLHKRVGFHIELKSPAWHREQFGRRMGPGLIELLQAAGVDSNEVPCFIQCFEFDELRHLHAETNCPYPLVQLLGGKPLGLVNPDSGKDQVWQFRKELVEIAKYANGIGPSIGLLVNPAVDGTQGYESSGLAESAHELGLFVHPYTVRVDALPQWCNSVDELHDLLLNRLNVDGFFTDFPDLGRRAVDSASP